jgi:hypothetical protein
MKRKRWPGLMLAGLGLGLSLLSGCQTWVAGMTLPSGRYLEHPPQYFPPSPPFPLARELASQERANAEALGVGGAGFGPGEAQPLPPPIPPGPGPGPGPGDVPPGVIPPPG